MTQPSEDTDKVSLSRYPARSTGKTLNQTATTGITIVFDKYSVKKWEKEENRELRFLVEAQVFSIGDASHPVYFRWSRTNQLYSS